MMEEGWGEFYGGAGKLGTWDHLPPRRTVADGPTLRYLGDHYRLDLLCFWKTNDPGQSPW